jgi:dTDP-4-dehydrorhamnose 3,5-epimerase-like enzyme
MELIPGHKEREELIIKAQNPFQDERGKIENYELPESVNLIATITSKKGTIRANHYHPVQEQKCLLLSGAYVSVYKDLLAEKSKSRQQLVQAGDLSIMPPMVAHTMIFLEDSTFLNLVNGNRDHEKFGDHTIKYELVKPEDAQQYIQLFQDKLKEGDHAIR